MSQLVPCVLLLAVEVLLGCVAATVLDSAFVSFAGSRCWFPGNRVSVITAIYIVSSVLVSILLAVLFQFNWLIWQHNAMGCAFMWFGYDVHSVRH